MNRSPKQVFLTSPYAKEFASLAMSEAFEPACEAALNQLLTEMVPNQRPGLPIDPLVGLDVNGQMQGAKRVLEILQSIGQPETKKQPVKNPTLHY